MKLLVAGGGTGGHVYPGLAIGEEFLRRGTRNEVLFVGTERGLENKIVPSLGYQLRTIDIRQLVGVSGWNRLRRLSNVPVSFLKCRDILQDFKPDRVLGVGGYAAGPMVLTAAISGYPTAIHEQNLIFGWTNELLSRVAEKLFVSFDTATSRGILTGNPLWRRERKKSEKKEGTFTILILGGSQGAKSLNHLVLQVLPLILNEASVIPSRRRGISSLNIIHQTGLRDFDFIKKQYESQNAVILSPKGEGSPVNSLQIEILPFIDDISSYMEKADIVISRAGAIALTELAFFGKPSILVPYPHAAASHQKENALYFVNRDCAAMVEEGEGAAEKLVSLILQLVQSHSLRDLWSERIQKFYYPNAAQNIVNHLSS